jgi:mannitol/fructose-specific phosphotransferase system IIA component (Ntr-type)
MAANEKSLSISEKSKNDKNLMLFGHLFVILLARKLTINLRDNGMRIHRFLKENAILTSLKTYPNFPGDPNPPKSELARVQEGVVSEFVKVFEAAGQVSNTKKLKDDLLAREQRTSTAIGCSIAFPHVRTTQARRFCIAIGRSEPGLPFGAIDNKLVHVFVAMITPPHDDKFFLKVEQTLAQSFAHSSDLYDGIMSAQTAGEIVRIFSQTL